MTDETRPAHDSATLDTDLRPVPCLESRSLYARRVQQTNEAHAGVANARDLYGAAIRDYSASVASETAALRELLAEAGLDAVDS